MDPSSLVPKVQAGCGMMVWGIFSQHTLGPLVPTEHQLKTTAFQSIVADHDHPFMTTVYHLLMDTSNRLTHYVTKLESSPTGLLNITHVHCTQMVSTVTRSHSMSHLMALIHNSSQNLFQFVLKIGLFDRQSGLTLLCTLTQTISSVQSTYMNTFSITEQITCCIFVCNIHNTLYSKINIFKSLFLIDSTIMWQLIFN